MEPASCGEPSVDLVEDESPAFRRGSLGSRAQPHLSLTPPAVFQKNPIQSVIVRRSDMRARLFCKTGELAGAEHQIDREATIGRGAQNTIVLPANVISQHHARIAFDPLADVFFLEDLHSKNGTRLDGARVDGRQRLSGLNVVTLGEEHDFIFVALAEGPTRTSGAGDWASDASLAETRSPTSADAAGPADSTVLAPPTLATDSTVFEPPSPVAVPPLVGLPVDRLDGPISADATIHEAASALRVPPLVPDAGDGASSEATVLQPLAALRVPPLAKASNADEASPACVVCEIRGADGARRRVTLGDGRHVVGRALDCDVQIDDRTLSRQHAAFSVRAGAVTVEDLASQNGTFVDSERVLAPVTLEVGQTVTLGDQIDVVWVTT